MLPASTRPNPAMPHNIPTYGELQAEVKRLTERLALAEISHAIQNMKINDLSDMQIALAGQIQARDTMIARLGQDLKSISNALEKEDDRRH
jgi:ABC-type molybdate transport system ATPase subunit